MFGEQTFTHLRTGFSIAAFRAQELCESPGGRPVIPVLNSPCGLCGRKASFEDGSGSLGRTSCQSALWWWWSPWYSRKQLALWLQWSLWYSMLSVSYGGSGRLGILV